MLFFSSSVRLDGTSVTSGNLRPNGRTKKPGLPPWNNGIYKLNMRPPQLTRRLPASVVT